MLTVELQSKAEAEAELQQDGSGKERQQQQQQQQQDKERRKQQEGQQRARRRAREQSMQPKEVRGWVRKRVRYSTILDGAFHLPVWAPKESVVASPPEEMPELPEPEGKEHNAE